MAEQTDSTRRYGGFEGVFVPTLVTILGLVLYLRVGWVVGNAGLLGALGIIALAFLITGAAALSISSISTNVPPGSGGVYWIVGRTLGIEAAGAVGLPLYLAKSTVVAFYIFGFRDGWTHLFPDHPALAVDLAAFAALVAIVLISTKVAFRVQYLVVVVIIGSLIAMLVAALSEPFAHAPALIGDFPGEAEAGFPGTSFWVVFAVFFPATTGLESGISMSGELKSPRKALSVGTMAALGVSAAVYVGLAIFLGFSATSDQLISNYFILTELAWAPAIYAGLLGATFSSALASIVGAPRILRALADDGVPPASEWLSKRDRRGEPKHALIVTLGIVLAALLMREINAIAELITLFFLATYGASSAVVLIEQSIRLPSYRPSWRIKRIVPLIGLVGSVAVMLLVNALFTVVAAAIMLGVLVWLTRRRLESPFADVRGAAYSALAQWAQRKAVERRTTAEREWVPHWLAPVHSMDEFAEVAPVIRDAARPNGVVRIVGVKTDGGDDDLPQHLSEASKALGEEIDVHTSVLDEGEASAGPAMAFDVLHREGVAKPNLLLLHLPEHRDESQARAALREAEHRGLGAVLVLGAASEEQGGSVAMWLRPQEPGWQVGSHLGHADLALLLAFRISRTRDVALELITAVDGGDVEHAEEYLENVADHARLPNPVTHVINGSFPDAIADAPEAGVHVFPLSAHVDFDELRDWQQRTGRMCLFVRDSGSENAFA
jgi:solute carrier family 12 (sodium/potassium/chloride transporter), member 2